MNIEYLATNNEVEETPVNHDLDLVTPEFSVAEAPKGVTAMYNAYLQNQKPVSQPMWRGAQVETTPEETNEEEGSGKIYKSRDEFKSEFLKAYEQELARQGIDTNYASYLAAQDSLESNWGKSSLAKVYNFGGIKAYGDAPKVSKKTTEYDNNEKKEIISNFRKFSNLSDYVKYKVNLLKGDRYRAFTGPIERFYERVKAGGYATDPNYVSKLTEVHASFKSGGKLPDKVLYLVDKCKPNHTLQ